VQYKTSIKLNHHKLVHVDEHRVGARLKAQTDELMNCHHLMERTMTAHTSQRAMLKAEKRELTKQIKELTRRLSAVERLLAKPDTAASTTGRGRQAANGKQVPRAIKRNGRQQEGLPKTGGDFWVSMLGKRPRSFSDVVSRAEAAIAKSMKKELSDDDKRRLNLRARVAIKTLADTKAINSEGAGRARRYSATA